MTTALKTNAELAHLSANHHPNSPILGSDPAMTTALKANAGLAHFGADPHPHSRVVVQS